MFLLYNSKHRNLYKILRFFNNMMAYNILVFVSEVLALHTLTSIIRHLKNNSQIKLTIIHDGFCTEAVDKQNFNYVLIRDDFSRNVRPFVKGSDLILSGKSYVQPSEVELMDCAREFQKPYFLFIPDIGGQIALAKLIDRRNSKLLSPSKIFISDKRTLDYLVRQGMPKDLMIAAGSPYFDDLYKRLAIKKPKPRKDLLAYISTPFELDHRRGIFNVQYEQSQLIKDIKNAARQLNLRLVSKRHVQLDPSLFNGIKTWTEDVFSLIAQASVVVGSYSTGLLEAAITGVPTISYQPWFNNIREDVFYGRIPIAKTYESLIEKLSAARDSPRNSPCEITYNPGKSIDVILNHVYSTLNIAPQPA